MSVRAKLGRGSLRLFLPLVVFPLQACGADATSPEGAQARFDATLAYAKGSIEKDGGRILSAYLADGTDSDGETKQFLCGLAIDKARARAFTTEAAVEADFRALFQTDAGGRADHPVWKRQCMTPAKGPGGQEVSMRAEDETANASGPLPEADAVDAAIDTAVNE